MLLWKLSTKRLAPGQKADVMGHVWDENLEEYNNPLPRWWMWLFWITHRIRVDLSACCIPGWAASPACASGRPWASTTSEMAQAKEKYEPIYAKYAAMDIPAVAADPQAREMGQRLFLNYCCAVPRFGRARRPRLPQPRPTRTGCTAAAPRRSPPASPTDVRA